MASLSQIKSLGIFSAPGKPEARVLAHRLAALAKERGIRVEIQTEDEVPRALEDDGCLVRDELASCDVLATFSGDGGVLGAARAAAGHGTPVLAFDMGRLVFLATLPPTEVESGFAQLLRGEFEIEDRMMLESTVWRSDRAVEPLPTSAPSGGRIVPEHFQEIGSGIVLNDAVVAKSALARILRLSIYADGELVSQLRADGLIISTPTGSTAYALSAGGPIVSPSVPLLLVCPICAHTLTQRPFIVSPEETLEVRAEWEGDEVKESALDVMLTLDGQVGVSLMPGDIVRVSKAKLCAKLLRMPGDSFYRRLRHKMGWGG
jgi:NAD+ kinase